MFNNFESQGALLSQDKAELEQKVQQKLISQEQVPVMDPAMEQWWGSRHGWLGGGFETVQICLMSS
jgi:hypothetical protein